jgi:hypothetical protein
MRTTLMILIVATAVRAQSTDLEKYRAYRATVQKTADMVRSQGARALTQKHGLRILNLTWEDTGRFKNSSVGPNISDMTIQVQLMHPRTEKFNLYCMPVIRFPNFTDKTGDIALEKFLLLVGNQSGAALRPVTLREYLGNFRRYLTKPKSWKGKGQSLLAERDTHVLVSAQACFLPIPRDGKATFNPVLFNYQSYAGNPAVLAILATREGASATIIDNVRDRFTAGRTWGQRLFFNQRGERASLTGERLSDFRGPVTDGPQAAGESGLNLVLLIQVPLRVKQRKYEGVPAPTAGAGEGGGVRRKGSDVEDAVIGHGRVEGPYTEIDHHAIQRDARFPVRVTVQFYKATSNGVVSRKDVAEIAAQIERVYRQADFVGSLVVAGNTGRPTEYEGPKTEPPGWWHDFWVKHEKNTGQTCHDAMLMLRELLGDDWMPASRADLAQVLKRGEG